MPAKKSNAAKRLMQAAREMSLEQIEALTEILDAMRKFRLATKKARR